MSDGLVAEVVGEELSGKKPQATEWTKSVKRMANLVHR